MVVVLTGATGFLGAHVLDILRQDTKVDRIVCLVRAETPAAAHERVDSGLRDRLLQGLEAFTSETFRTAKVSCLPCTISAHHLGLSDDDYAWLCESTSTIIHAAWTVNFTLGLSSFEEQIVGTRNLISTAAASGARFALVSSTAAVSSSSTLPIPETLSIKPRDASSLGYSQSKWVAEGVLAAAVLKTSPSKTPPALVLRVGQLCGNQRGVWNASEAYPLLLSTTAMTGCLPDLPGTALDWLPVEVAAQAVVEAALGGQLGEMPVYHIVNSREAPTWTQMLDWIRDSGHPPKFEVVPTAQWVTRLATALGEHRGHPSEALLGLWKGMSAEGAQAPAFEVAKTKEAVDVMRSVVPLDRERVVKMWRWVQGLSE